VLPGPESLQFHVAGIWVTHPQSGNRELLAGIAHVKNQLQSAAQRHSPIKVSLYALRLGRCVALTEFELPARHLFIDSNPKVL